MNTRIYEVYVEGADSDKYICLESQRLVYSNKPPSNCARFFGEIPYEKAVDFIDLEKAVITRSILILHEEPSSRKLEGCIIEADTPLCLQEVRGRFIYFLVDEESRVEKGEVIAYHVTSKFEVRSIKSKCSGQVALIIDMPWEIPRKALIVVITSECRRVVVEKSA